MKLIEKIKHFDEKEINFMSLPLCHYGIKNSNNIREKYFSLFPKSFEQKFLDAILKPIYKKHDYIFIVRTPGIGEAYLLNFMFDELKKKYNFKSPCIVIWRGCYEDMYRLYLKDVPVYCVNSPLRDFNESLVHRFLSYKGKKVQVLHGTLKESLENFEKYGKDFDTSWPKVILNLSGVENFTSKYPEFSKKDKEVLNIASDAGLNLDNFVFVLPDSRTTKKIPENFWNKLLELVKESGLDVFVNTKDGVCSYGKSAAITISQAMYLASKSKAIISTRCGLLELLSTLNMPKFVFYTAHNFQPISAKGMIKSSSLCDYPMVLPDTVFEYDNELQNEEEILNDIREKIRSLK